MAKAPKKDTTGNAVPNDAIPMHKKLAMGMSVQTGAGKGATGGDSKPSTGA
jgi:hypothetical protein